MNKFFSLNFSEDNYFVLHFSSSSNFPSIFHSTPAKYLWFIPNEYATFIIVHRFLCNPIVASQQFLLQRGYELIISHSNEAQQNKAKKALSFAMSDYISVHFK